MKPTLPKARGNKEFKKYQMGDRLTQRQAILAKCADCMGFYFDGRIDCQLPDCPLYPYRPYKDIPVLRSDTPRKAPHGTSKKIRKGRGIGSTDEMSNPLSA